jgi:ubiquinone biosynthesis protein
VFSLLVDVLRRNRLTIPPALVLVLRTLTSLDGTLRLLSAHYSLTRRGIELASSPALRRFSVQEAIMTARVRGAIVAEEALRLGRRIESIARQLDDGTFSARVRAFDSRAERSWVDGLLSRLTTTIIGVTLVIAGVMLGVSDTGPMLTDDVPALSFLGGALGLGGLLLLLRSLGRSFRDRG